MIALSIDVETCSDLSLPAVGAYKYATHRSTKLRCMAWKRHDIEASGVWRPGWNIPQALEDGLREGEVHAWNAQFERLIFKYCISPQRLPHPSFNQWRCTMALARSNALPGKLETAAKILQIPEQKMDKTIMKKLSDAGYSPTDEELLELCEYCMGDVKAEHAIAEFLPPWTPDDLASYRINERINDRGVLIDRDFALSMIYDLSIATGELNEELSRITEGQVTAFTQVEKIKKFIGRKGSLDGAAIEGLLDHDLTPRNRRILEIRRDGAKSSTSKYSTMIEQVSTDDRLRGMFQFSGAGQTGRYSSTGVQLHNLVRDVPKDAEARIELMKSADYETYKMVFGEPLIHQAAQLIRPTIMAPEGKVLLIGDYSQVEARGLPWLAGVQHEVDAWAAGADRYVEDASNVFNIPVTAVDADQRQAGKVVRLACGFSGKGGALLQMAKGYGLNLTKTEADTMAKNWHAANPWVEKFAKLLMRAAVAAVKNPGEVSAVGDHLKYACEIREGIQILRCQLPSGRVISYHDVKVHYDQQWDSYYLSAIKPRSGTRERLWHGLLAENVTQAVCNDLLRHALVKLSTKRFKVVAHVHDEAVAEGIPEEADDFKAAMEERPEWAADFPLEAKVAVANRYTK